MTETAAERNRRLMPNVAPIVEEFKRQFPDCQIKYVKDLVTGHSAGEPSKHHLVPAMPIEQCNTPLKKKERKK